MWTQEGKGNLGGILHIDRDYKTKRENWKIRMSFKHTNTALDRILMGRVFIGVGIESMKSL